MTTLPLKSGGTTITILHPLRTAYGDTSWDDGKTITGCMYFPSFSNRGRIMWRGEQTANGDDVVLAMRTLYMPFDTVIAATDRVLVHPPGLDLISQIDDLTRREGTYDVMGEPMYWQNQLTGWAPCCEVALLRVT
jgi:hypothetical protein